MESGQMKKWKFYGNQMVSIWRSPLPANERCPRNPRLGFTLRRVWAGGLSLKLVQIRGYALWIKINWIMYAEWKFGQWNRSLSISNPKDYWAELKREVQCEWFWVEVWQILVVLRLDWQIRLFSGERKNLRSQGKLLSGLKVWLPNGSSFGSHSFGYCDSTTIQWVAISRTYQRIFSGLWNFHYLMDLFTSNLSNFWAPPHGRLGSLNIEFLLFDKILHLFSSLLKSRCKLA